MRLLPSIKGWFRPRLPRERRLPRSGQRDNRSAAGSRLLPAVDELEWMRYSLNMTIDERIEALTARHEALTMNLEQMSRDRERDAENIRALVRIAEIHERRLTRLEGTTPE